jgi:WD40 repeat protein
VKCVAYHPGGRLLASGGDDREVAVWDALSGRRVHSLPGPRNWVLAVAFSPDGGLLASGSEDKTVRVWDAVGGRQLLCLTGHTNVV